MHDQAFADAIRPAPVTILGLRLRPYSLGHELTLQARRNPLLCNTALALPQQAAAVSSAVYVCACDWAEINAHLPASRWALWLGAHQRRRFERAWRRRQFGWAHQRCPDWVAAGAEFAAYRANGSSFPPPPNERAARIVDTQLGLPTDDAGRSLGAPYYSRLLAWLVRTRAAEALGYGTPWDMPLGLAHYLYHADREDEGRTRIENHDEARIAWQLAHPDEELPAEPRLNN